MHAIYTPSASIVNFVVCCSHMHATYTPSPRIDVHDICKFGRKERKAGLTLRLAALTKAMTICHQHTHTHTQAYPERPVYTEEFPTTTVVTLTGGRKNCGLITACAVRANVRLWSVARNSLASKIKDLFLLIFCGYCKVCTTGYSCVWHRHDACVFDSDVLKM